MKRHARAAGRAVIMRVALADTATAAARPSFDGGGARRGVEKGSGSMDDAPFRVH